MSGKIGAILVAAGASRRAGFDKLWAPLGGRVVLSYPLEALGASPRLEQIALVVSPHRLTDAERLAAAYERVMVCIGGEQRRDSVAAGLQALDECDWVLVHDAARPFLAEALIERGLEAARATGAAVAGLPLADTVKRALEGLVLETLPRDQLWSIQTPQVFRADLLRSALQMADRDVTDEATLIERQGGQVRVFPGSEENWKITTAADLELAEAWLATRRVPASPRPVSPSPRPRVLRKDLPRG